MNAIQNDFPFVGNLNKIFSLNCKNISLSIKRALAFDTHYIQNWNEKL